MKFNAQKCCSLPTKARSSFLRSLGGVTLKQVQHCPYLGVHISADLKWSTHISNICKRAGSTLDFLRRNLRKCPQECRRLAYISLSDQALAGIQRSSMGSILETGYRLSRDGTNQAARFMKKDYRMRETGCVGHAPGAEPATTTGT